MSKQSRAYKRNFNREYAQSRRGKLGGRTKDTQPQPVTVIKPDGTKQVFTPSLTTRLEEKQRLGIERARDIVRDKGYDAYLRTRHWQHVKAGYYATHDKRCDRCGSTQDIHLHHKTYDRLGAERHADLVALCRPCHEQEHGITSGEPEATAAR